MSLYRITSRTGDMLAAAQSLDGVSYLIGRHFSPGRYHVDVMGENTLRSADGSRCWGYVIRHDDGQVSLEPCPESPVTRSELPDSHRQ